MSDNNPLNILDEYRKTQIATFNRIEQKLDDVKERLVRLEAHDSNVQIKEVRVELNSLKDRLTILETKDNVRMGIVGVIAGSLASFVTALVLYMIKGS